MSLHLDALGKALSLDGSVIHLSGPLIPVGEESLAMLAEMMGLCCMGVAVYGPERCTCWKPMYDLVQADPVVIERAGMVAGEIPARGSFDSDDETLARSMTTRTKCCDDCAYRHGSPERTGDEFLAEALLDLPGSPGRVFVCHQGMVRVVSWRHPCGVEIPAGAGDYRPLMIDGVAYRADGSPAELCAGWAALR